MESALIGLGANLGDPARQLREALRRLAEVGTVVRVSSLYRSAPVGGVAQPDFLNAACVLSVRDAPHAVLAALHRIEAGLGRERRVRFGPRTLDLDLLDQGGRVLDEPDLVLPHPRLAERAFVLVPLAEIVPGWRHPTLGRTARELIDDLPRAERVTRVGSFYDDEGEHG